MMAALNYLKNDVILFLYFYMKSCLAHKILLSNKLLYIKFSAIIDTPSNVG